VSETDPAASAGVSVEERRTGGLTLKHVLPGLQRWLWLVLACALIPPLLLGPRLKPTYTTSARLQLTAPPSVDVALYQQGQPYSNLRDDLTVARTDFVEAARSPEVRARTVAALGLTDADAAYILDVRQVRDSDFTDLVVEASTADVAQRAANAHAEATIQYAAELRSLPARATAAFLTERLQAAEAELAAAQADAAAATDQTRADQILRRAQDNYQLVQNKLNEAQLKSATSYSAQSMQIVTRAPLPLLPNTSRVQTQLALSGVAGLVIGVMLALAMNVLSRRPVARRTVGRVTLAARRTVGRVMPAVRRTVRRMLPSLSGLAGVLVGVLIAVLVRAIAHI
jgi:uncharacterized protein involved in exopolysaccharide biosynthesis